VTAKKKLLLSNVDHALLVLLPNQIWHSKAAKKKAILDRNQRINPQTRSTPKAV